MKEYIPLVFFACIVTHTHCHSNGIKLQDFWIFFCLKSTPIRAKDNSNWARIYVSTRKSPFSKV